jgi:hypothetical protein
VDCTTTFAGHRPDRVTVSTHAGLFSRGHQVDIARAA